MIAAKQSRTPNKMRTLKNADCDMDFFFIACVTIVVFEMLGAATEPFSLAVILVFPRFHEWKAFLAHSTEGCQCYFESFNANAPSRDTPAGGFPANARNLTATTDYQLPSSGYSLSVAPYGRGAGVGRGLAVGWDLGVGVGRGVAVAVGVGLIVGVAVGVAVGVGVGVGEPPTAAKMSTRPQPYTLFGGPASPHSVEAILTAELFKASRLSVS